MIRISGEQYEVDKFIEENLDCLSEKFLKCIEENKDCIQCLIKTYNLEVIYDQVPSKQ